MKIGILTTTLAGFGLAVLPLQATDSTTEKPTKSVAEKSVTNAKTIPAYLVVFSGGG